MALLDGLGINRVAYCGLSKGGMVGQMLGVRHRARVSRLILANTSAHMPTKDMWEGRVRTVAQGGMAAIADATIGRWFTPASQERLKEVIDEVREMILGTPPHGFIGCCRAIQSMDQRKTISGIETPTLVIVGAEDPATTPEHAREIHGAIKGARYIEIPDAAHLSNIEQPAAFTKAVRAFLDD